MKTKRNNDTDEDNDNVIQIAPKRESDNDANNDDDVDDTDGKEVLQQLLSPQGALVADMVGEIVRQLNSTERNKDLASMSRGRYAVTQCVTLLVALLAVGAVIIVTFSNNEALNQLLLTGYNGTWHALSSSNKDEE